MITTSINSYNNVTELAEAMQAKFNRGVVIVDLGRGETLIKVVDRWALYETRELMEKLVNELKKQEGGSK